MVLYVIGLGLGDEKDITVRGLEAARKCKRLYLEFYTSILGIDTSRLQAFYEVPVILADRNMVETEAEMIYSEAIADDIGFLVVGDPLCATTHTDLILRAKDQGVTVEVKEPDFESMGKGKMKFLPPRFMTVNTAIDQLLEVEADRAEGIVTGSKLAVGMARLGQPTQKIVFGTLNELRRVDFGGPLHCLALCGEMHPLEEDILKYFRVQESDYADESAKFPAGDDINGENSSKDDDLVTEEA